VDKCPKRAVVQTLPVLLRRAMRIMAAMFLRATTRKKDGKTHRYWSVVENRRLPGGACCNGTCCIWVRSFLAGARVAALGGSVRRVRCGSTSLALFPDDRLDDSVVDGAVVRLRLSQLRLHRPRVWASCWLALQLWEQLDLERFWSERLPANRKGTRWDQVLFVLVAYRLLSPGSEWRLHRQWFERSALSDLLGVDAGIADIHKLYAVTTALLHTRQRCSITWCGAGVICSTSSSSAAVRPDQHLLRGQPAVCGRGQAPLRLFARQALGLRAGGDRAGGHARGPALAYEVMAGDTADSTTLRGFLERIEQQYGKRGACG